MMLNEKNTDPFWPGEEPEQSEPVMLDSVQRVMKEIRDRKARGGRISGISTGYITLDAYLDGLRPATMTVIGARPKMGKTAFALGIARNLVKDGAPVSFFSLEMPEDTLTQRLISIEADVTHERLTRGLYDDAEGRRIEAACRAVSELPLRIHDGRIPISDIENTARRDVEYHGAKVVLIDYLQLVKSGKKGGRYEQVTEISMEIAELRKKLNVPIIVTAQLNRAAGERANVQDWKKFVAENSRPNETDLRESGQIEQDADALLFLHRPEVYLEKAKPLGAVPDMDFEAAMTKWRSRAEVIVHYNRSGRTGSIMYRFDGPLMSFSELTLL